VSQTEFWVARCHLVARSPSTRRWAEDADEAITTVAVLAEDEADLKALLQQQCHNDGLELLRLDAIETLLARCRREGMAHGLIALAHTTSAQQPVAYGEMLPLLPEKPPEPPPPVAIPPVHYAETDWKALFTLGQPPLWAVIDGVNCREARATLSRSDAQYTCLYASTNVATQTHAPWLVRLEADSEIRTWLESLPQDQHWGILLQSNATLKQLRTHLRKFTMLWTPANDQAPVYFRFYDPRVALDMSQALPPWQLAALMAPFEALITPVSPLMAFPAELELTPPIDLDAGAREVHGRLVRIALSQEVRAAHAQGRPFAIGDVAFQRFSELAQIRARDALARSLKMHYPHASEAARFRAVIDAMSLGQRYQLTSKQQLATLAMCVLELGGDFPQHHPEAQQLLDNPRLASWRKRDLLAAWLPRGRVRHALLAPYPDPRQQEDNYRPITDKERP